MAVNGSQGDSWESYWQITLVRGDRELLIITLLLPLLKPSPLYQPIPNFIIVFSHSEYMFLNKDKLLL